MEPPRRVKTPGGTWSGHLLGSLAARLVFFGISLVVLTSVAVGWRLTHAAAIDLRSDLEARGLAIARGVSARAERSMQASDRRGAQRVLDGLWEEDDVAQVELTDLRGRVIAERDFGLPLAQGPGATVVYPVLGRPDAEAFRDAIGTLRLRLSTQGLEGRLTRNRRSVMTTTAGVAAGGLLVALAVGLALAAPLRRLQASATRVARGDYSEAVSELPETGAYEIRALGDAFRAAAQAVQEREADLRDTNTQLRETEAARDAMTNMVIHDLKGPIGNVITLLGTLELSQKAAQDRVLVGDVRARCRALLRTIESQLDMARLAGNELAVNRQHIEVGELLMGAMDQIRSVLETEGFEVNFQLPDDDLEVAIDRPLMERVLVNLLLNAVKHGASPVTVAARHEGDWVEITVDDSGPGVPEALKETVFDRYVLGDSEGSGLGLALVRLALEAHGGDASVEGARFTLRLPA